jgi:hypothetical protein
MTAGFFSEVLCIPEISEHLARQLVAISTAYRARIRDNNS